MPEISPNDFSPGELRKLAAEHRGPNDLGYRPAVRFMNLTWSGAWGRAFEKACSGVSTFGNVGADCTRFSNTRSVRAIHDDYLALTDRCEYALDVDITLQQADYYNCVCAGDIHLGPPECAYAEWVKLCDWILRTPDTGMIFHGDGLNVATLLSPSSPAIDRLPYSEQVDLLLHNLGPLADAGCLRLVLAGNHEVRIRRATGVDECPMRRVAHELGVPYGGYEQFVRWRIKGSKGIEVYTGYHHHGRGAARTQGGILNNLVQMAMINRADYLAAGHTHHLFAHIITWREVAPDGEIIVRKAPVINTGSYQRTQGGSYSTEKAYAPALIGAASIHLYGSKHSVHART